MVTKTRRWHVQLHGFDFEYATTSETKSSIRKTIWYQALIDPMRSCASVTFDI
jgi:hypothetical protein